MFKKIFLVTIVGVFAMNADWLDDLTQLVFNNELDIAASVAMLEKHMVQDQEHITKLEQKIKEHKESGFWAMLRGGTLQAELTTTKSQMSFHERVAKVINELPQNKKDREKLINNLIALKRYYEELKEQKEAYNKVIEFAQKVKIGAQIAAKEIQIQGQRTLIKTTFFF